MASSPPATTTTAAAADAAAEAPVAQSPKPVEAPDAPAQDSEQASGNERAPSSDREDGEASETEDVAAPPLPSEPTPDGPPLPNEPVPQPADDGWDCQWDPNTQGWFFANRFTGKTQWENPRVPTAPAAAVANAAPGTQPAAPPPPTSEKPAAGGYNPAIHGDYDPNAWYAKGPDIDVEHAYHAAGALGEPAADGYGVTASFNRFTGTFQNDEGTERHTDEAKSRRQMNAFFDVDAAANCHDGRSLKAERSGKKPSKSELKAFKEKRRVRKEEKRRAWLRD